MDEYEEKVSWTKKFSIQVDISFSWWTRSWPEYLWKRFSNVTILCELNNGEILLEIHDKGLFSYDPKSEELKPLRLSPTLQKLETCVTWPSPFSARDFIET